MADTYQPINFVQGELLTSQKMNIIAANQDGFHTGEALADGIIGPRHLDSGAAQDNLGDSDWISITAASGHSSSAYVRMIGNLVVARGQISRSSGNLSTSTAAYLPEGFEPSSTLYYAGMGSSTNVSKVGIYSDGTIGAAVAASTGYFMISGVSWFVD